jgi:hypothetical protein
LRARYANPPKHTQQANPHIKHTLPPHLQPKSAQKSAPASRKRPKTIKYSKLVNPAVVARKNRLSIILSLLFLTVLGWILFIFSGLPLFAPVIPTVLMVAAAAYNNHVNKTERKDMLTPQTRHSTTVLATDQTPPPERQEEVKIVKEKVDFTWIPKPTYVPDMEIEDLQKPVKEEVIEEAVTEAIDIIRSAAPASKPAPAKAPKKASNF